MGAPQIIMVVLLCISAATNIYIACETSSGSKAVGTLLGLGIEIGLLMWGGFFH